MLEYECLKQNDLFPKIKRNTISSDILTVLVHNLRRLSKLIMLCYVMLGEFTLYLPNDCMTQLRSRHIALGCLGDLYVFKTVYYHLISSDDLSRQIYMGSFPGFGRIQWGRQMGNTILIHLPSLVRSSKF